MEGKFGGCKLWSNGKENFIGGIKWVGINSGPEDQGPGDPK